MTAGLTAMLIGVFLVPAGLLWAGHRLRRRSPRWRRAFWGALVGHVTALVIASIAGMTPPEEWAQTDTLRGLLAYWSFVVFPALGALLATVTKRKESDP